MSIHPHLIGLSISDGIIEPKFSQDSVAYTIHVNPKIADLTLSPKVASSGATIRVNGTALTPDGTITVPIPRGISGISVEIAAGDGITKKEYQLTVHRMEPGYYKESFEHAASSEGWFAYGGIGSVEQEPGAPDNRVYKLKHSGDISIAYLHRDGTFWKDYVYEARVKLNEISSSGGLAFKVLDENNFYYFCLNGESGRVELLRRSRGTDLERLASSSPLSIDCTSWHKLMVEVEAEKFRGFVDGEKVVEWENSTSDWEHWCKIGFRTQQEMMGDDIEVKPIRRPGSAIVTAPTPYTVFQRDADNKGLIRFEGFCDRAVSVDRVEARLELMLSGETQPWPGEPIDWTPISCTPASGSDAVYFNGSLQVAAGGWYRLKVRGISGESEVFQTSLDKVGVGEIFLVGGQSNAGNSGFTRITPADSRVSAISRNGGDAAFGQDPLHGVNGIRGSAWAPLGERLVKRLGVPVAFVGYGQGGTAVAQWLPESVDSLYPRLKAAIKTVELLGGARAILWHQGENDSVRGTSTLEYKQRLTRIVEQSRLDAVWNPRVPWGIAIVSYSPHSVDHPERMRAVAEGQILTIANVPYTFTGPTTDDLRDGYRRIDEVSHMNEQGQLEHARRWEEVLMSQFFGG